MDLQTMIGEVRVNDWERNRRAVELFYTCYGRFGLEEIKTVVPHILYYLWKLPKFQQQKEFVVEMLGRTDEVMRAEVFEYVVIGWNDIESSRKDKFYYLLQKILDYCALDVETISRLFTVTEDVRLLGFIVRCVVKRLEDAEVEESIEQFLISFASKCAPALLLPLKSLRFNKELVMKYAKSKDVGKKNREALYSMIGDSAMNKSIDSFFSIVRRRTCSCTSYRLG